ncbi:hypothetical protein [Actinophytocola sp.]|uniref:hypothetical protein n=1 Tax=Actinophytocola sp. TaxID=1872138 RepID=UPI00389A892F
MNRTLFHRTVVTAAATTLASTAMVLGAGVAHADIPTTGQLCDAVENIQFYANDYNTPSYTVQRGEQIRIDSMETLVDWAVGHGTGHSARNFIYIHSNGAHRLTNCRWT